MANQRKTKAKATRLDAELDRAAIKLLKDAFPRNNASKATAVSTAPEGSAAVPQSPGLAERVKVFTAIADYRALRAKLDGDDDDSTGSGTLADLQRKLHGGEAGGGPDTPTGTTRVNGG